MTLHPITCGVASAMLVSSAFALQRSRDWVSVGGTYRVMSNVGSPTPCAYDMAYLVAVERLGNVITPPEHGDSPKRLQEVARLQREIATRQTKGQAVLVSYNTRVKALAVTPERDSRGIPRFARLVALSGPLKGKPFWSRYGFVKALQPLTGEPGMILGKATVYIPKRLGMLSDIEARMRRQDTAGLSALVTEGNVATVRGGTSIKVSSSTVKGVLLIETTVGGRRFKGWIDRARVGML